MVKNQKLKTNSLPFISVVTFQQIFQLQLQFIILFIKLS